MPLRVVDTPMIWPASLIAVAKLIGPPSVPIFCRVLPS